MADVGTLSIKQTLNSSQFKKGLLESTADIRTWQKDAQSLFEQTRTPMERYEKELTRIIELHKLGAITSETYSRAVNQLSNRYAPGISTTAAMPGISPIDEPGVGNLRLDTSRRAFRFLGSEIQFAGAELDKFNTTAGQSVMALGNTVTTVGVAAYGVHSLGTAYRFLASAQIAALLSNPVTWIVAAGVAATAATGYFVYHAIQVENTAKAYDTLIDKCRKANAEWEKQGGYATKSAEIFKDRWEEPIKKPTGDLESLQKQSKAAEEALTNSRNHLRTLEEEAKTEIELVAMAKRRVAPYQGEIETEKGLEKAFRRAKEIKLIDRSANDEFIALHTDRYREKTVEGLNTFKEIQQREREAAAFKGPIAEAEKSLAEKEKIDSFFSDLQSSIHYRFMVPMQDFGDIIIRMGKAYQKSAKEEEIQAKKTESIREQAIKNVSVFNDRGPRLAQTGDLGSHEAYQIMALSTSGARTPQLTEQERTNVILEEIKRLTKLANDNQQIELRLAQIP